MQIENITFENIDTPKDVAIKTALIYAGSTELKKQMQRLKVKHTKVQRGFKTIYVLRSVNFGRVEVIL
jgi:hypothetical protein